MYVFRSLRVKALVTNLEKQQKKFFFIFTWYMVTFSHKMICIKNVFKSVFTFINPYNTLFCLKSQKQCQ